MYFVRSGKSEAEVTNNRRQRSTYCTTEATDLHWLDVPERVPFKLCMTGRRCMQDKASQYLKEYCISLSDTDSRQRLRSASRHLLSVPHHRRTFGRRAFAEIEIEIEIDTTAGTL